MKMIVAALAAWVLLPAAAQSLDYTPSAREAQQARDNAKRDQKLADAMEKARLKEEAKPAAVYIPTEKEKAEAPSGESKPVMTKPKKPYYFTAVAPGEKKSKKKKKDS